MIEHCISAFNYRKRRELYEIYTTESLRYIAKASGYEIPVKYHELIKTNKRAEDTRGEVEIIGDIKDKVRKLRGGVKNGPVEVKGDIDS